MNVRTHDPQVVCEYVERELARKGQIFYVVPKIKFIEDAMTEVSESFESAPSLVNSDQFNSRDF